MGIKKVYGNVTVKAKYEDTVQNPWSDPTFGKHLINKYKIVCTNNDTEVQISYPFYDSIHNTLNKEVEHDKLLDDVVSCITSDFRTTLENYPSYEDFAHEFGYDEDSRKGEKTYKECIKLGEKLNKVFSKTLIEELWDKGYC